MLNLIINYSLNWRKNGHWHLRCFSSSTKELHNSHSLFSSGMLRNTGVDSLTDRTVTPRGLNINSELTVSANLFSLIQLLLIYIKLAVPSKDLQFCPF